MFVWRASFILDKIRRHLPALAATLDEIGAIGLEDVIVMETADALLVAKRGESQKVKKIVEYLEAQHASEHVTHPQSIAPGGALLFLEEGPGFKIKRIEVKPGGRLSLQSHKRRSEHWVVCAGEDDIQRYDDQYAAHRGQSRGEKASHTNQTSPIQIG